MRFVVLVRAVERPDGGMPSPAMIEGMHALGTRLAKEGLLVEPGGLLPTARSTRMRIDGGTMSITDGPYAEAKEVVGGFAFYNCESYEQAYAATKDFMALHLEHMPGWEGECELRQVVDAPPPPWL